MGRMWKRIAIVAAWVVATIATAAITLAAVGQAGHRVSERPSVPVSAEDLAASVTGGSTSSTVGTTQPVAGPTSMTTTTAGSSTTSSPSTTMATSGPSTTSGTSVALAFFTESRTTAGGTVTVAVSVSTLSLSSAIPAQGFDADIHSNGSTEVEVRFQKHDESVEYRVKARLEDGVIRWEIRDD